MTLTMMCGLPNSGKTAKARELAAQTGATLIRLDSYTHLYLDGYKPQNILAFALRDMMDALNRGEDVIYDAVNATADERRQIVDTVDVEDCRIVCVYMQTPEAVCIARDRSGWSSFYAQRFEAPAENEGFALTVSTDGVGEADPVID